MPSEESVTLWLRDLRQGDDEAASFLWDRYFSKLVQLARQRLGGVARRDFDEEDVVVDVLDSVCRGIRQGRYPRLADRTDLWRLLFTSTLNKAASRVRRQRAERRGGGRVRGESVFGDRPGGSSLDEIVIDEDPAPEVAVIMIEQVDALINQLGDDCLRDVARLKLSGLTDEEIATELGCVRRTVVRRLRLIREIWSEAMA